MEKELKPSSEAYIVDWLNKYSKSKHFEVTSVSREKFIDRVLQLCVREKRSVQEINLEFVFEDMRACEQAHVKDCTIKTVKKKSFKEVYNNMPVDIMGVRYTIRVLPEDDEYFKRKESDGSYAVGYCETFARTLYIKDLSLNKDDQMYDNIEVFLLKVIRHEAIHAFFAESGQTNYYSDENLVDALAMLWPKMNDVMQNFISTEGLITHES